MSTLPGTCSECLREKCPEMALCHPVVHSRVRGLWVTHHRGPTHSILWYRLLYVLSIPRKCIFMLTSYKAQAFEKKRSDLNNNLSSNYRVVHKEASKISPWDLNRLLRGGSRNVNYIGKSFWLWQGVPAPLEPSLPCEHPTVY